MKVLEVYSFNSDDTIRVAGILGSLLELGDIILLEGNLAAGKTTFVKGLARELNINDHITSPTYTIANFYKMDRGSLLHVDAYRLSNLSEFHELGLDEYLSESITVIEWGEKVATDLSCYLSIKLDFVQTNENHRKIAFCSGCEKWILNLEKLESVLKG